MKLAHDVVLEHNGQIITIPKGHCILEAEEDFDENDFGDEDEFEDRFDETRDDWNTDVSDEIASATLTDQIFGDKNTLKLAIKGIQDTLQRRSDDFSPGYKWQVSNIKTIGRRVEEPSAIITGILYTATWVAPPNNKQYPFSVEFYGQTKMWSLPIMIEESLPSSLWAW